MHMRYYLVSLLTLSPPKLETKSTNLVVTKPRTERNDGGTFRYIYIYKKRKQIIDIHQTLTRGNNQYSDTNNNRTLVHGD